MSLAELEIQPDPTTDYKALERLKETLHRLTILHFFFVVFDLILMILAYVLIHFKLAGNEDKHNILIEF